VFARTVSGGIGTTFVKVGMTGAGEVVFVTAYDGAVDLGGGPRGTPGTSRCFVAKLGATGEEMWTRDLATGAAEARFDLAVEAGGGFTLAGSGLSGMTILAEPTSEATLFVASYDAAGEPLDVQTFPRTNGAYVMGMGATADGALVLAGGFSGTLDFGQDQLVAEGEQDAFVARICR